MLVVILQYHIKNNIWLNQKIKDYRLYQYLNLQQDSFQNHKHYIYNFNIKIINNYGFNVQDHQI